MLNRYRNPEARYARRMARIARWDRPLESRLDRARAWSHMLLSDHGIFRVLYLNLHRVTPKLWRAAQPTPHQIAGFAKAGAKSVVTLRGGREFGAWPLEREACAANGLALEEYTLRSRAAPTREEILGLDAFFGRIAWPAVVHCKSGADRAGFMSALYLLLVENRPAAEAMDQLHWRFGHFRFAKTGILDAFLAMYAAEGEAKGISFRDWVANHYDPERLEREFRPGFWSNLIVERVLRRE